MYTEHHLRNCVEVMCKMLVNCICICLKCLDYLYVMNIKKVLTLVTLSDSAFWANDNIR